MAYVVWQVVTMFLFLVICCVAPTSAQTLLTTVEVNPDLVSWLNSDNTVPGSTDTSGITCGTGSIYNALTYKCQECPNLQIPDTTVTDTLGNFLQCRCAPGYQATSVDCSGDQSGNCVGLKCALCDETKSLAAYSDGKGGCAKCATPATFSYALHDCVCPAGQALIEKDTLGNRLASKTCAACPTGDPPILPYSPPGRLPPLTTPPSQLPSQARSSSSPR